MLIRAICGRLLRTQYPCKSAISVGEHYLLLEIILPQIPQILYIPISVLIRAICGRLLRTQYPCKSAISVGEHHLLLESYSPTDSTDFHRFYISRFPCSSVLSVGDSSAPNIRVNLRYLWENTICCLRFILPQIPQIFTDFIYPDFRVNLCYLWETPPHAA